MEHQDFQKRLGDALQKNKKKGIHLSENAKVLPQARELEEAVLGAIMLEKDAIDKVLDILIADSFYVDSHMRIYRAMLTLYSNNEPIDLLTVNEQLKKTGELEIVGGAYFIAQLTNKVSSSANIEFHARIISQKYLQRELIAVGSDILRDAYDETIDVFDLLDKTESNLFELSESNIKKKTQDIRAVLLDELKEIEVRRLKAKDTYLTGVGSGFLELDRLTAGWQKSDLVILAARPGMGKTAFTLALARHAAVELDKPVAFFSLEMSSNQLVSRLISMETEIASDKLRKGELLEKEWKHLTRNIDNLQNAPLFIDDTPALGIFELRAKCRRLKSKHDVQMIIIDYLQLMSGTNDGKGGGNREQEISYISRSLKGIAKELDVPIIALSQLSRAVETRGGLKRPMLSDLRESGAIEQDADMVIFLYRPEYYNITEEDGVDIRGQAEVIVEKNRHGDTRTIKVKFVKEFAKFVDLESQYFVMPDSDGSNTITKSSKMNEDINDDLDRQNGQGDFDDTTPF